MAKEKLKKCETCGQEIAKSCKVCPNCGAKNKKPFYKKWCGDSWRIIETLYTHIYTGNPHLSEDFSVICVFIIILGKINK